MKIYKLSNEGVEPIKGRVKNLGIGLFFLTMAINLFIHLREPSSSVSLWITFPVTMVMVAFALYIGLKRGLKAQQDQWSSYELLLGADVITRKQAGKPDVMIQRHQVTGVQEVPDSYLLGSFDI